MATQKQRRALDQQLTWIGTVESLAASYGKPELAASLRAFGEEVQAGTLTWDPDRTSDEDASDPDAIRDMMMLLAKVGILFVEPKDATVRTKFLEYANRPHSLVRRPGVVRCECGLIYGSDLDGQPGRDAQAKHRSDVIRLQALAAL